MKLSGCFFLFILALLSCKADQVELTISEISVNPSKPGVLDEITNVVSYSVFFEGDPAPIDNIVWKIEYEDGTEIFPTYQNGNFVRWTPNKKGTYSVSVKISAGGKSYEKLIDFYVENTINTYQKLLIGDWEGRSTALHSPTVLTATFTLSIDSDGQYVAVCTSNCDRENILRYSSLSGRIVTTNLIDNGDASGTMARSAFSQLRFSEDNRYFTLLIIDNWLLTFGRK